MGWRSAIQTSAIANGTGSNTATALGGMGGTMYYVDSAIGGAAGGSALIDILHSVDPTIQPWYKYQTITAAHLDSAAFDIGRFGGYWLTQVTIYSGGGNTGRITTYLEFP